MKLFIREATPEDAADIARISSRDLGYPCDAALVATRLTGLDRDRERVFLAICEDRVIGFLHAELYRLLYQQDQVNVLGLAVDAAHQGHGAGRLLMEAAETWAHAVGAAAVRLNSAEGRQEAHAFYAHLGYRHTKTQKRFTKALR